jgi:hypothetical protein
VEKQARVREWQLLNMETNARKIMEVGRTRNDDVRGRQTISHRAIGSHPEADKKWSDGNNGPVNVTAPQDSGTPASELINKRSPASFFKTLVPIE